MSTTLFASCLRSVCGRGSVWRQSVGAAWHRSYCDATAGKTPADGLRSQLLGGGLPLPAETSDASPSSQEPPSREALASIRTGRDIAMVFTCKKCETRAVKTFSRQSYERGLVLVRCPGCQNLHLVADNLGWFGDKGFRIAGMDIRSLASQAPAAGLSGSVDSSRPSLSAEDLIGASKVQQLIDSVAAAEAPSTGAGVRKSADGRDAEAHSPGGSHLVLELTDAQGGGHAGVLQVSPEDAAAYEKTLKSS